MKNLLLLLVLLTAAAGVQAHEVASVDTGSSDSIEFWILDEVN